MPARFTALMVRLNMAARSLPFSLQSPATKASCSQELQSCRSQFNRSSQAVR